MYSCSQRHHPEGGNLSDRNMLVATMQQNTSATSKCSYWSAVPCVAPNMITAETTNMKPRIKNPNEAQQLQYHQQPITTTQIYSLIQHST